MVHQLHQSFKRKETKVNNVNFLEPLKLKQTHENPRYSSLLHQKNKMRYTSLPYIRKKIKKKRNV